MVAHIYHRFSYAGVSIFLLYVLFLLDMLFVNFPAHAQETSSAATAHEAPVNDGLPLPGFQIEAGKAALVITDPQNDFLSEDSVTWGVVGKSVTKNNVVENLETLM